MTYTCINKTILYGIDKSG